MTFILRCEWKFKFFGMSSKGLFQISSGWISHLIHIVRTSCGQLPSRSAIFCLLIEVVYWSCGLKLVYPTINLAFFLRIIVKVKFLSKFCLHNFDWFCLQISSDAKSFSRHRDRGLLVVIRSILFSNLRQKKKTTLLLVELLAVTWVPCLLRHLFIYTYAEWTEMIGQSHGSHIYWDTCLFIHMLSGQKW